MDPETGEPEGPTKAEVVGRLESVEGEVVELDLARKNQEERLTKLEALATEVQPVLEKVKTAKPAWWDE